MKEKSGIFPEGACSWTHLEGTYFGNQRTFILDLRLLYVAHKLKGKLNLVGLFCLHCLVASLSHFLKFEMSANVGVSEKFITCYKMI